VLPISSVLSTAPRKVVVVSTGVEEFSVKPIRSLPLTNNTEVLEIKVNTDPLTAPIYGLIISSAVERV